MNIFCIFVKLSCLIAVATTNNIEPRGNGKIQESAADCALSLAVQYFEKGSIIAIVTSGLRTVTNFNLTKTTYNLISDKIMQAMQWSIMIKNSSSHGDNGVIQRVADQFDYVLGFSLFSFSFRCRPLKKSTITLFL